MKHTQNKIIILATTLGLLVGCSSSEQGEARRVVKNDPVQKVKSSTTAKEDKGADSEDAALSPLEQFTENLEKNHQESLAKQEELAEKDRQHEKEMLEKKIAADQKRHEESLKAQQWNTAAQMATTQGLATLLLQAANGQPLTEEDCEEVSTVFSDTDTIKAQFDRIEDFIEAQEAPIETAETTEEIEPVEETTRTDATTDS